jgi:multidrug transporter EmrE-like cation transporter
MLQTLLRPALQVLSGKHLGVQLALIGGNLLFNVVANAGFKVSAASSTWRGFLLWQVVGNLAGFVTVLTLTGLLRFQPLHVAYPLTAGLAVIGVQVLAARWFFHESITAAQWVGTLLVAIGIMLVSHR